MEVSVIGGGPIGMITARALLDDGHQVRLFDPSINKPTMSLALAESTLLLLERTGVDLEAGEDLTEILVTEKRLPGSVLLQAVECGYPRFGRVICSQALESAVARHVSDNVEPIAVETIHAEEKRYLPYYMHGTGHFLGLDVHDVGAYEDDGQPIELSKGMVITCEPGLYIDQRSAAPERYRGIGIRIEDDVLITNQGPDILTAMVPKGRSDIETLMRG